MEHFHNLSKTHGSMQHASLPLYEPSHQTSIEDTGSRGCRVAAHHWLLHVTRGWRLRLPPRSTVRWMELCDGAQIPDLGLVVSDLLSLTSPVKAVNKTTFVHSTHSAYSTLLCCKHARTCVVHCLEHSRVDLYRYTSHEKKCIVNLVTYSYNISDWE